MMFGRSLALIFPSLFTLATKKEAMVANVWDFMRMESGWIPRFSIPLNDWKLEEVERLFQTLQR